MTEQSAADGVIDRIYDAVSGIDLWGEGAALRAAAKFCDADAVMLIYGNISGGDPVVVAATGFKIEVLDQYAENHLKDDEFVRESMLGTTGIVISSGQYRRDWDFYDSIMYRRLLWPCELHCLIGTPVLNQPKAYSSLWMSRRAGRGEFTRGDIERFSQLVPHFGRAMAIHHRVNLSEKRAELATGAFDRVSVVAVSLKKKGDPILANREAVRIALRQDGFVFGNRCLAAENPADSKRLRELIRRVGESAFSSEPSKTVAGGATRIRRPSGQSDYHVVVMPLPQRCQPCEGRGAVGVLFITDPDKMKNPIDFLFGDLYGLTEAEVRLVSELMDGRGLTAAAESLGLSRNTVHSQLASIFQKTGTRRQGELLSLLLGGVAPIEAPAPDSGFHQSVSRPRDLTH
jgi:DNA-binding CsgD family transcriptional regulator